MAENKTCPICGRQFEGDTLEQYSDPLFDGESSTWWQDVQYCSQICKTEGIKKRSDVNYRLSELETRLTDIDDRLKKVEP